MRMSAAFCIAGWLPVYLSMDVVEEVEEMLNMKLSDEVAKVKKVQDNVCLVLQKLLEANPGLNIDMAQIYGTILGDTGVDGTPLTGGRSTYTICYLSSTLFSKTCMFLRYLARLSKMPVFQSYLVFVESVLMVDLS
ncbi:uncharacterized protein LOC141720712 [Apium graveolens]|uniref:uncharacterized protein LOC141720712 n=1 Tax=Apium graveolens TaxID=4045 RepID=UPI003D7BADE1